MNFIKKFRVNIFTFLFIALSNLNSMDSGKENSTKKEIIIEKLDAFGVKLSQITSFEDIINELYNQYRRVLNRDPKKYFSLNMAAESVFSHYHNNGYSKEQHIIPYLNVQHPVYEDVVAKEWSDGNIRIYHSSGYFIDVHFKESEIDSLIFSPDGRYLFASSAGTIAIWEIDRNIENALELNVEFINGYNHVDSDSKSPIIAWDFEEEGTLRYIYGSNFYIWRFLDKEQEPNVEVMPLNELILKGLISTDEIVTAGLCTDHYVLLGTNRGYIFGLSKDEHFRCKFKLKIRGACYKLSLSSDGRFVCAASDCNLIREWDLVVLKALNLIKKNTSPSESEIAILLKKNNENLVFDY